MQLEWQSPIRLDDTQRYDGIMAENVTITLKEQTAAVHCLGSSHARKSFKSQRTVSESKRQSCQRQVLAKAV